MNSTSFASIDRRPPRTRRIALIATIVAFGIGGCGGGGGAGSQGGAGVASGGPTQPTSAASFGSVTVTVKDVFGASVPGAVVTCTSDYQLVGRGIADASGRFSCKGVPRGRISVQAYDESVGYRGLSPGEAEPAVILVEKEHVDLVVTVQPFADATLGVAPAVVEADGVAADGGSLVFSLRLIYIQRGIFGEDWFETTLADCVPATDNDAPTYQADCIKGPAGFDAPYRVADAEPRRDIAGSSPKVFSAALLLDQSRNIVANDPWDRRLFLAKSFLLKKGALDQVMVAAFASDDTSSGELSALPQKPTTLFPIENPAFTASSGALFPTIDSLDQLEGGGSPLHASIDRLLDFTATHASASARRAVVVLTDGQDDTCGSPTQCQQTQDALIEKSRATGVEIVTLGLLSTSTNRRNLSELTEASGGVALWADDPRQLGILFSSLNSVLDGSAGIREVRYRIESPTTGAFQSGRTVLGTIHFEDCPWDCTYMDIPFAVRIP